MENTQSVSSDSPISAPSSPQPSAHKRLKGLIFGILGVFVLGGGVAAFFVTSRIMNPAAGIPIPNIEGTLAFRVPEAELMANATYTREDGQIVHYVDEPSVLERAWTEKNHHMLIKFTPAFGLIGEVDPQEVILGRALTSYCQSDVTHVKDAWYYVYTSGTFERERDGTFPTERFLLGNCRDLLNTYSDRYNGHPKIKAGDLVYVAIPPAEVLKLEKAPHGEGFWGNLRAATGPDADRDGLIDIMEANSGVGWDLFDSDSDGIGDGLEVAGGDYAVTIAGRTDVTHHLAANTTGWSNPDTDLDGINDATELGFTASQDPKPEESVFFVADADPLTTTNPNNLDTDEGGVCDGLSKHVAACKDGQDNDEDRKTDFPEDTGCASADDRSEDEKVNCEGGEDVNKDGKIDENETDPNNKDDDIAPPLPGLGKQCENGADDDGDTLIDLRDLGCANADDQNEGDGQTDLEVKKTGPAEATNGSKVTYVITVTNKGPDAVTSAAAITDNVPAGLEYIDAESHADCEAITNNNTIRCGNIKLAKDASVAFSLVFHVTTTLDVCGKDITNKTFVSETPQGDSNEANNESSVTTKITCVAPPLTCGNGTLERGETCDDRNVVSGDGCSALCTTESGYTCTGAPSVCTANAVCGNGTKEGAEECDDGNAVNTDACNACKLTTCGDRIVQNPNGRGGVEECDEDSPICTPDCKKIQFPEL